jgi:competence protein ComEC
VGQGTAVLVRTQNHLLLYDAGPQYARDSDAGQRVLLPMLRGRGVTRIDKLVLSHRDTDHVGGARSLLGALAVDELVSSLEDSHPLLPSTTAARTRCAAGQSWSWDGVRFDMLAPQTVDFERGLKPNALSCVLRVSAAQGSALLTGDIEREQESVLVAAHGVGLRSDVLIVPHHGSKSSSTALFLDTVSPRWAVVQAGYRNRFGHPAQEVMARYLERKIEIVDSASCGAWFWHASQGMPGSCLRETSRRYWRHDALRGSAR